jgi:hypothetical protein
LVHNIIKTILSRTLFEFCVFEATFQNIKSP